MRQGRVEAALLTQGRQGGRSPGAATLGARAEKACRTIGQRF